MEPIEIFYLLFLNGLPIIFLAIPIPFIYKRLIGKLYLRVFLGIVIFFLVYWILPIMFQTDIDPKELQLHPQEQENIFMAFFFIFSHMMSLIGYFFQYPFVTLTFIFLVGPLLSFLILWRKLRKEPGVMRDKLADLTFEFKKSPSDMIEEGLIKGDWSEEKQLLKLLIVLLPISLYLISVIIELLGLESIDLTTGTTTMGWFVEILFVYIATLLVGIHLVYSSKISFKGVYIGEKLREDTFRSLFQVGTPISLLSILLFLADTTTNYVFILYFFAYFMMGAGIFILFHKIFQPIAILIFIKLIDLWKRTKTKKKKIDWTNWYIPLIIGVGGCVIFLIIYQFLINPLQIGIIMSQEYFDELLLKADISYGNNIFLEEALRLDLFNIINTFILIFSVILFAYLFSRSMQFIKKIAMTSFIYLGIVILISILVRFAGFYPPINFAPEEYWITGSPAYFSFLDKNIYTIRTVLFKVNLSTQGGFPLLEILAIPFTYTRYVFNLLIWGLILYYLNKIFIAKNVFKGEKMVEKISFSRISEFPKFDAYVTDLYRYLVVKTPEPEVKAEKIEEREEVKDLLEIIKNNKFLKEIRPIEKEEMRRFYFTLKYLFYNGKISFWIPEFTYDYEKVELQGLYVIYSDGRDLVSHNFKQVGDIADSGLIAGLFTAITAFIKEATKSSELLKTIDHGDITIIIEYGKYIFSALFVKGRQSLENRSLLKEFVEWFEEKHKTYLPDWTGALHPFRDSEDKIVEIFKEEEK